VMRKELDFAPSIKKSASMRDRHECMSSYLAPARASATRCKYRGFTVIELLVTMLIVSILIAIAIPTLKPSSTVSEANSLLGALQFARSVAVKQGQSVIVCPSTNPTASPPNCSLGTSWNSGWIVVVPSSGSCVTTATTGKGTDVIVQIQQAFTGSDTAVFSGAGGGNTGFCFTRLGFAYAAYTGQVTFKTTPAITAKQRCTVVSGVGHVQVIAQGQADALGVTCP